MMTATQNVNRKDRLCNDAVFVRDIIDNDSIFNVVMVLKALNFRYYMKVHENVSCIQKMIAMVFFARENGISSVRSNAGEAMLESLGRLSFIGVALFSPSSLNWCG
jgi:hypothetical protein